MTFQSFLRSGFTLIELIIVMTVMAILAVTVLFGINYVTKNARDVQRQQFLKGFQLALEVYRGNNNHYPFTGDLVPPNSVPLSQNDSFNQLATLLAQSHLFDMGNLKDPSQGLLFSEYTGGNTYTDGPNFTAANFAGCGVSVTSAQEDNQHQIDYSYFSADGSSYILCLKREGGGFSAFVNPQN